mgnify:CR=1 FL=1
MKIEKQLIMDPPSGWKYGFPKPIPEERLADLFVWLVEEGYPQYEIDNYGENFAYRTWRTVNVQLPFKNTHVEFEDVNAEQLECLQAYYEEIKQNEYFKE